MLAEDIFKMTMAMIDEMLEGGGLDEEATKEYRAKAPFILTMLQTELIGIDNRFRDKKDWVYPVPIETLDQTVQVDEVKAKTLLTNGLAAQLMLHEDKTLANYFEQRYEEMKGMFIKPTPRKPIKREDVYDATLNY